MLSLLSATTVYSQKKESRVIVKEKVVGRNLVDSLVYHGMEYVFSDMIDEVVVDASSGIFTIQLRGLRKNGRSLNRTGRMVQYDNNKKEVLWSKKINYTANRILQYNNTIVCALENKSYRLDILTGNNLWKVKNDIFYVDHVNNIGIGYRFNNFSGHSNLLEGINLQNGCRLWSRVVHREVGWKDLFYSNDSTLMVVATGLHSINVKTGKGLEYPFVRTLISNTLIDSSNCYFASRKYFEAVDMTTGKIVWNFPFEENIASRALIFIKDSILFIVNKGMAFAGNKQLEFGKPFFAAFDKKTGREIFFSSIKTNNDPILNFEISNSEILFICKNRILKYTLEAGAEVVDKAFDEENFGTLKHFIQDQIFKVTANNELVDLKQTDSSKVFVMTSSGKILLLDKNFDIKDTVDRKDMSVCFLQTQDLRFFTKGENVLVVNNSGKSIAEIEASSKAIIIGTTLYDIQCRSLIALDLGLILSKN
jgi:hypothetical protein